MAHEYRRYSLFYASTVLQIMEEQNDITAEESNSRHHEILIGNLETFEWIYSWVREKESRLEGFSKILEDAMEKAERENPSHSEAEDGESDENNEDDKDNKGDEDHEDNPSNHNTAELP